MNRFSKVTGPVFCLIFVTGCSFQWPIQQNAVDYNRAAATSSNKLILLNIVRSMKRHAHQYTAITQIRGNFSASVGSSANLPVKGMGLANRAGEWRSPFAMGCHLAPVLGC